MTFLAPNTTITESKRESSLIKSIFFNYTLSLLPAMLLNEYLPYTLAHGTVKKKKLDVILGLVEL